MMKKNTNLILVGLIILFVSTNTYAWDGQRQGFILGFGIGPGFTSFTQKIAIFESDRETKGAIMTDFKIGYAPHNFLEIYYTSKVSWFGLENVYGNNVTIANGLGAAGVSYFFRPEAPSPFISGGLGFSTWATPFEEGTETWSGLGIFVGGGYEFARHWRVEGYLSWGKPTHKKFGVEMSSNALSFMCTINVLGY